MEVEKFLPDNKILATVRVNEIHHNITIRSLRRYAPNLAQDDIGGWCYILGDYLIVILTWASDQAGVMAVWGVKRRQWLHVSEGAYTLVALPLFELGVLISLCYVHNFSTPPYHWMGITKLGVKDGWKEPEPLKFAFESVAEPPSLDEEKATAKALYPEVWTKEIEPNGPIGLWISQNRNAVVARYGRNLAIIPIQNILKAKELL